MVECASYTHARRHPLVLGRIGGWAPPFQLSLTQLVVLLGGFAAMVWTWSAWAPLVPDTAATMASLGAPSLAAWALRRVRIEGRSLPRGLLGYLLAFSAPADGVVAGRPLRTGRRRRGATAAMWVAER